MRGNLRSLGDDRRGFGSNALRHRHLLSAGVGPLARKHFVKDATEGEDVAAAIELMISAYLLRTHVVRRAGRHSRGCQCVRVSGSLESVGDSKVRYEYLAILKQDVRRLDVTMHESVPMRMIERARDLRGDADCFAHRKL